MNNDSIYSTLKAFNYIRNIRNQAKQLSLHANLSCLSHMNKTWLIVNGNNDKNKPVKTIASTCRDLIIVYLVKQLYYNEINLWNYMGAKEPNTSIFVKLLQHQAITYNMHIRTTDANKPEKKDQVLKTYVYCTAKLSIIISCGKYYLNTQHINMFWLTDLIDH